ncbi:RND family transporter [Bacillus cytotoxicus]|uniref:efflux RND transporter permease subunit n=1 Tax=Bacillus cereus group sp. BfR-BA-01492 TaxID=2920361 RepID=UPI001F595A8F|nr:hydrophobe/amphiphile efflux-3 (HAE3) family transporter [Bacillus cereus group sp. BfR-BA-01492]EMA6343008.1 MMPL family transporter [Bacillus cytotoxicus]
MNKIFDKIGHFIIKYAKTNIALILCLTIFFTFGITKLEMKMGNDVFLSNTSDVYKDTAMYQKHFGGDGIYVLLSGDSDKLLSQETNKAIVEFTKKAEDIKDITGSTHYVRLLNEMFDSPSPSFSAFDKGAPNKKLEIALKNSISSEKMSEINNNVKNSLTDEQREKMGTFIQQQLTTEQMQEVQKQLVALGHMPTADEQEQIMQAVLTDTQNDEVTDYTQSILTQEQKDNMQREIIKSLPNVQNMNNDLLHEIIFSDQGKVPAQFKQLIPENGKHVIIQLHTSDNTEMTTYVRINKELNQLIKNTNFNSGVTVKVAGMPAILGDIQEEVITTLRIMLGLAIILMIVVLFFVFPVRRRIISLGFVLIGLIWTFGFMGWTGIPITLATMATLPIIIGLGTDFGVQFHNRYEEEFKNSQFDAELAIRNAVRHIGPGVGIAVVIMSLSFLTMYLSKAPMMQQFGLTLAMGVLFCYVVELVLMFSTFYLLDHKKTVTTNKVNKNEHTLLARFLNKYANIAMKFAIPILIVSVILSGLGFMAEKSIPTETDLTKMIPQNMETLKNTKHLQKIVGSTTYITYLVEAKDVTEPKVMSWMQEESKKVDNKYKDVSDVISLPSVILQINGKDTLPDSVSQITNELENVPSSLKDTVMSTNKKYATIQFQVNPDLSSADQLKLMHKISKDMKAIDGVKIKPAGAQVMMLYGIDNIGANSELMIGAGLLIIFLSLFLVYRRVKHALYPLIPIALVLGFSPGALKLLDISYNPLTTALSCLVLGIGTEFTILIMERFREEEEKGLSAQEAIRVSLSKVGQAITVSGLTVIVGFSALIFVNFPILREFGITTVIDTTLSLLCSLTILPALIVLFRKRK